MRIAFDLDGTLADNSKREHIAHRAAAAREAGSPTGHIWDEFHSRIPDDQPIPQVAAVYRALVDAGHLIEIWTARPIKYHQETIDWMRAWDFPYTKLLMRSDGDWRKAYILKLEMFMRRDKADRPQLVFEDHPETTRLLRLAGAVVAQVGEGHNV